MSRNAALLFTEICEINTALRILIANKILRSKLVFHLFSLYVCLYHNAQNLISGTDVPNVNLPLTLKLGCLIFTLTTVEYSNCLCFMSNPYLPTLF